VPSWLTVQEFEGSSWVGLVPFTMSRVTFRGLPPLPILSHFAEMNLRLYVEHGGKPGVWFISLDAARRLAVWGARTFAHLPYFLADMRVAKSDNLIRYASVRRLARDVVFRGAYWPDGPIVEPRPGTLEHFLTERYCLYAEDKQGRRRRLEIHHHPWPLQHAGADFEINCIAAPQGITLPRNVTPVLHYCRRQEVIGWLLESI
jgi:hypothetical protein